MMLDFDDLLLQTYLLLKESSNARDKYKDIFKHLLVDEFQDTNPAQMGILDLLIDRSGNGSSFWVCGDDWQSIYAFTGASVGNILNFKERFPRERNLSLTLTTAQALRSLKPARISSDTMRER